MKKRPYVLSVAGFDPSGGAGLVADCKTFEALRCQGLAVCTANTLQTDTDFEACHWTEGTVIKAQIELLFERFSIPVVKIGIVENWKVLLDIVSLLRELQPKVKIILDPVLSASAGFDFHTTYDEKLLDLVLDSIFMVTPNETEFLALYASKQKEEKITHICFKTHLFLKGGHNNENPGKDYLYSKEGKMYTMNPKLKPLYPKHGSGCVLSSAVAAHTAREFPLLKSCFRAKRFTEKYLGSSKGLLGNFRF